MDTHFPKQEPKKTRQPAGGFALVVTLSVMVLLAILSVGLLSLSSVSLRNASRTTLLTEARSNARLALMLAIGEVQKTLGPDRSAAAPASMVFENPTEPHVSGVWKSWTWNPTTTDSAPDYAAEKESLFQGWLVSDNQEPGRRLNPDFPTTRPADAVTLVGKGSASSDSSESVEVVGGVVTVDSGNRPGQGYAWVALQEDVKAHIQPGSGPLPATESANLASMFSPDESGLKNLDFVGALPDDREIRQRTLSSSSLSLAAKDTTSAKRSFHHLSPHSQGVLADAALGGLRRDLTTEFENFSASSLNGQRLYDAGTGAEPWWDGLASYYQLAKRIKSDADGGATPLQIDSDLTPYTEISRSNSAPKRTVLSPVVAKVDVVFSIVTHDLHGSDVSKYAKADPNYQHYSPWFSFEPIITLWNPYNIPIQFSEMKVFFDKIPVGLRFAKKEGRGGWNDVRNADDEMPYWWPLSYYVSGGSKASAISDFYVRLLGGDSDTSPGGEITLDPGETRVFTAWVGSRQTWGQVKNQFIITNATGAKNTIQANGTGVKYAGGWNRTGGFTFDHLARWQNKRNPSSLYAFEKSINNRNDWHRVILRSSDGFRAKARLLDNDNPDDDSSAENDRVRSFQMKLSMLSKNASGLTDTRNVIQNMEVTVKDFNNLYQTGEPKIIEHDIVAGEAYQGDSTKGPGAKSSFAVLSLTAKPTRDLLHSTKGWLFGNPVTANVSVDENLAPYSVQSHEISFLEIFGSTGFPMIDVDLSTGTRGFFGSGQSSQFGLTAATMFTLPREPMTSIGQFQSANLLSSGELPHFNYPVGNSHSHPLISSDRVKQGDLLDHSFALNWSLWDSYYFSSLSEDSPVDTTAFANGTVPTNSRLTFHTGASATTADAIEEMTSGDVETRSLRVASHQMLNGVFNVNSTSVDAWKAVLSGLRDRGVMTRDGRDRDSDDQTPFARFVTAQTDEDEAKAIGGGAGNGGNESDRAARWVGIHLLDDEKIAVLAEEIVEQIKLRGQEDSAPILTLGEFVNRRPGSPTDLHSQKGLLQTAIEEANRKTDIYSLEDGDAIDAAEKSMVTNGGALDGNTAEGSPADLLQGDILQSIGSFLTTHPDTLRIRAYGRAGEASNPTEAWCEAIIQRVPEYVDPGDAPEAIPATGSVNERFGRRFNVVSFRWLSKNEI